MRGQARDKRTESVLLDRACEDETPAEFEHPADFRTGLFRPCKMVDGKVDEHDVERLGVKREVLRIGFFELDVRVQPACHLDHAWGQAYARHLGARVRHHFGDVARPAAHFEGARLSLVRRAASIRQVHVRAPRELCRTIDVQSC